MRDVKHFSSGCLRQEVHTEPKHWLKLPETNAKVKPNYTSHPVA